MSSATSNGVMLGILPKKVRPRTRAPNTRPLAPSVLQLHLARHPPQMESDDNPRAPRTAPV